jgi:DNA-binding GntR family transcriptional regulator
MASPEPFVRRSSGDQAALYIRQLIFDGQLRPGDRVPQDEIADALRMSRIPVREALIGLDREGWVRIVMHRGVFVATFDETTVRDHYELMGLAYEFAVSHAVAHWGGDDDRALAALAADFARADDPAERQRVAVAFHATIVAAARSPRLRTLLRGMPRLVPGDFFAAVPHAVEVQSEQLNRIAAAMRDRDTATAGRCYVEMLAQHAGLVVEVFRSRGLFEPASNHETQEDDGR